MIKRQLLNLLCDQKQNHTFHLRPRPFTHRSTQRTGREQPWRDWYQSARYYGNVWKSRATAGSGVTNSTGHLKERIECLLDEGSDTTYVNEIGLTGKKEPITVNVANDQTICFMSGTFEIVQYRRSSRHEDNREDFKQNLRWFESCELGQHLRQMESFERNSVPKARKRKSNRRTYWSRPLRTDVFDERSERSSE